MICFISGTCRAHRLPVTGSESASSSESGSYYPLLSSLTASESLAPWHSGLARTGGTDTPVTMSVAIKIRPAAGRRRDAMIRLGV
jgi:hypothetical protein